MSFQNDLKRYKTRHYNTTKEIGSLLGVSQRTAYRLLSGEKVPSKAQAEYFASVLAKSDPDLFAAAKAILPSGVSDDFFKSCLKQHRDTLSGLQMTIKQIQAEQSAQQAQHNQFKNFSNLQSGWYFETQQDLDHIQGELTSLWSELQAQKAEIDRLSQAKPSVWQRAINFIRGTN